MALTPTAVPAAIARRSRGPVAAPSTRSKASRQLELERNGALRAELPAEDIRHLRNGADAGSLRRFNSLWLSVPKKIVAPKILDASWSVLPLPSSSPAFLSCRFRQLTTARSGMSSPLRSEFRLLSVSMPYSFARNTSSRGGGWIADPSMSAPATLSRRIRVIANSKKLGRIVRLTGRLGVPRG